MPNTETFRDVLDAVGSASTLERVKVREAAGVVYAPKRKNINPKRTYQVLVDGKASTGAGFSTVSWKTKADAELSAQRKRAALNAVWDGDAPVVTVKSTTETVKTVQEWINTESRYYREYRSNDNGYTYTGVTQ